LARRPAGAAPAAPEPAPDPAPDPAAGLAPPAASASAAALAWLAATSARLWAKVRGRVLDTLAVAGVDAELRAAEAAEARAREAAAAAAAAAQEAAARAAGAPLPLDLLAERHGLDAFDREALLVVLAPVFDLSFGELLGRLRDHPLRGGIDVDLVLSVLCDSFVERIERRRRFLPDAPLVRAGLLLVTPGSGEAGDPLLTAELHVPEAVVRQLTGERPVADAPTLPAGIRPPRVALEDLVLQRDVVDQLVAIAVMHGDRVARAAWGGHTTSQRGRAVTVLLHGAPGTGKSAAAEALAAALGRPVLVADEARYEAPRGPLSAPPADDLPALLRLAEANGAVLVVDDCERWFAHRVAGNPRLGELLAALERFHGVTVLTTNLLDALDEGVDRHIVYKIAFELPPPDLREALWRRHVPPEVPLGDDVDLTFLARKFDFAGGFIKNAVMVATGLAGAREGDERRLTMHDLMVGARTQLRHRLTKYAERHLTRLRLNDLILPDDVKGQVVEVLDAVQARARVFHEWGFSGKLTTGRGLSVLLDGEPGTGKTLCAEIMAAELGLTLYRINVANVVDKYIGETEKNLTRIFREAGANSGQSLLLFDEADSLFAKRVDVKSSNDRFSNMEINVLLQLIERYEGLVVLTTNLKHGIDKAFERRLSFKINFPFPDEDMRERIWRHLVPAEAPLAPDVDFERVARAFELAGGSIRNSLVRAAYRAASEDRPITLHDFAEAARRECAATGKLYRQLDPYDD
jgi:SpoVK/Ycf46/Vps4 family AAA+-type ATPase